MGFGAVTPDGVREEPWWWQENRPTVEGDELPDSTDVLVVGSGYAGLACALDNMRPAPRPHVARPLGVPFSQS